MIDLSVTHAKHPNASREPRVRALPPAAFYCVADSRYFLGAVGMLNSLRRVGHDEPIFVLDCGLTDGERSRLAPHATVVPAPNDSPPWLLKAAAPLHHPADVIVLIDTDVVVTRPLTALIHEPAGAHVTAFRNRSDRFFSAWGELPGLGEARPRPYVSSSLVFLRGAVGSEVLLLMERLRSRVDFQRTFWRENDPEYPFLLGDQDLLNAILATRLDPGQVVELEARLEAVPPFAGLSVLDEEALKCSYEDGVQPYVLHHFLTKPWLEPTMGGVYTQLLLRLLLGRDVAIRISRRELPLHLQPGMIAGARRWYGGPFSASVRTVRDRVRRAGGLVEG
jgi:hypothetical protein